MPRRLTPGLLAGIHDSLGLGAAFAGRLDADGRGSHGLGDGRDVVARIEHREVVGAGQAALLGHLAGREGLGYILADRRSAPGEGGEGRVLEALGHAVQELVEHVGHAVECGLLALDGADIHVEEEARLDVVGVDDVVEAVEFLLEEGQALLDHAALDRVLVGVHALELIAHEDEPVLDLVLLVEVGPVHLLDLGLRGLDEGDLVPDLGDVLVYRLAGLGLYPGADLAAVDAGEVVEVGDALEELGVLVHHLEHVPEVRDLGLEALGLDVVGLALLDELGVVVVLEAELVALVGEVGDVGVLVLAQDELARVLEVLDVLVAHLGYVEDRGDRVDRGVVAAIADVLDVDDLLEVLANVELVEGGGIDLGAEVGDPLHELLADDAVALGFGIIGVVVGVVPDSVHPLEDDLRIGKLFLAGVDEPVLELLDLLVDLVDEVLGDQVLDEVLDRDLVMEDRGDELGVEHVDRELDVGDGLGLVVVVLERALDDRVGVLAADERADVGFLAQEGVGQVLQIVDSALDVALKVAEHVDHRFLDFAGVELVRAADLVEELADLLRGIAGQALHLFFVDEVTDLLDHLVFGGDHEAVEHVLIILVEVIVELLLQPAHDVDTIEDFVGKPRGYMVENLIGLLLEQLVDFPLLIAALLGEGIAGTDGRWLFGMEYVRTFGKIYRAHMISFTRLLILRL